MHAFESIAGGGVTSPQGFQAGVASCGIKNPKSSKLDLMVLHCETSSASAATFTSNQVKAAPVKVSLEHLAERDIRAVVVNSGNANACNGPQGIADAREMAALTAEALDLQPHQVFVESTGVIGTPMPMERIRPQIAVAANALGTDPLPPAQAIMTSDTVPKLEARRFKLTDSGQTVTLGGMAKGAGMICPNMATMLCFITTDAAVDPSCLQAMTREAVEHSFNRITIEGDMSTNDAVLVMANGVANRNSDPIHERSPDAKQLAHHLQEMMRSLAQQIVRDAEKATRFIELNVRGAGSNADAHTIAKAVANSVLVKCAWNAGQPYWGRIMHAIGYAGVPIVEERIGIDFNGLPAAREGASAGTDPTRLRAACQQSELRVDIDLNVGEGHTTVYSSDLSENFVEFNLLD